MRLHNGEPVAVTDGTPVTRWDEAMLWHPASSSPDEADLLQELELDRARLTTVEQAFRSSFPPATDPGQFLRHTARFRAALRSRGWTMAPVGGDLEATHAVAQWTDDRTGLVAALPVEAHYMRTEDFPNASSWLALGDVEVDRGSAKEDEALILTSEIFRDLDIASIESQPKGKLLSDPSSPLRPTVTAMLDRPLSDAGRNRHRVINHLLKHRLFDASLRLDGGHLCVPTRKGTHSINLNNGVVTGPDGCVLSKRPKRAIHLPPLPMESHGTLATILHQAHALSAT